MSIKKAHIAIPANDTLHNTDIPAIVTPKQLSKLEEDRHEWQKKYSYWLRRKNKFAAKLLDNGRTLEGSAKYQELKEKVQEYWLLLNESLQTIKQQYRK